MNKDEQDIRRWFDDWIKSTTVGDLALARSLIADDAIFLVPGAGQMDKETFAVGMAGDPGAEQDPNTEYELDCNIQEITVLGDHAYLLSTIALTVIDKKANSKSFMKGDSLSVLQKQDGNWRVIRDANTMVSVDEL